MDVNKFHIVEAKDAVVGRVYLSASMRYKIKIIKIDMSGDIVTSVTVQSESSPSSSIRISGGTELIEYDETLHKVIEKENLEGVGIIKKAEDIETKPIVKEFLDNKLTNITKNDKDITMPESKKIPRSKIIDSLLYANQLEGSKPDFNAIATAVIEQGSATEVDRKNIVYQASVRYSWYTKGGKVNPASKVVEGNVTIQETSQEETESQASEQDQTNPVE